MAGRPSVPVRVVLPLCLEVKGQKWGVPKIGGFPPKSSMKKLGFPLNINHPFWGKHPLFFGNTQNHHRNFPKRICHLPFPGSSSGQWTTGLTSQWLQYTWYCHLWSCGFNRSLGRQLLSGKQWMNNEQMMKNGKFRCKVL